MLRSFSEAAMPTDLDAAVAARKREARAETQTLVTIMLVCLIIFLGMFGLVFEIFSK
jgi:hypothetical protein